MSVWARNEQRRLVRIVPPRNFEESIISRVFQDNILPQMDHPENQQHLFNEHTQGIPVNQQGLHEPPQHGEGATLPVAPVVGGGNVNFQQNQYRGPPAPLPNVERTLREILQPQRTTTNSCIRLPEEANQFLMKLEMIRLLPVYQGFESENPYSFMRDFEDVCSAFLSTGSPLHIICLVLFPFALKEKAKIWFHSLAPNSIFTWENMRNEFLNKFFPPAQTNALMRAIKNFSEKPGEPFAVVWERYKDLLHAIPHHGLDVGQICAYFHQGLSLSNKQYVQMMCSGEFYEKSAREAIQLFDTIAENARTWETNTSIDTAKVHSTSAGGRIHHLRENDELQAKIANLTRKLEAIEMKKVNEATSVPQIPPVPTGSRVKEPCIICDDSTHSTINCPNLPQVKGAIQIEQANALNYQRKPFNSPYSETYNPGWGKHPNFSWRNEGGPNNLPNNQGPHYQNHSFTNPVPPFQTQGPQGFPVNTNQGFHPSNQGTPSSQPYQPPHKRSLEDIVTQFVQTQQSTNTEFRTALNDVRSQITKLTSSIGNLQQEKGKLPSQPIQNPQSQNSVGVSGLSEGTFEHCKAVTTLRSGKVVDKTIQTKEPTQDSQSELVREDEVSDKSYVPKTNVVDGEPEEDKATHVSPAPYPHRLRVPKKLDNHSEIYELFKQVKLNIPLLDAIKQIPSYAKFLKDLCTVKRKLGVNKEAFMTEQSTSLIRNNLPPKYKDPGSPTISIVVGNSKLGHDLVDLGASVNLLPYSVYVDLGLGELEPTNMTLQLADRSVKIPRGIVKDVLVQVDKFYFPVEFIVFDTQPVVNQGTQFPIILGRPFLETANAIIHCRGGLMTLSFGNMTVNLNIFNVIKGMGDEGDVCEVNMVDSVVQKYVDNVSHDDPLKLSLVSPSWDEEVTTQESEFLHSIIEHGEVVEVNGWAPKFEPLP